jgi:hypothetical protein
MRPTYTMATRHCGTVCHNVEPTIQDNPHALAFPAEGALFAPQSRDLYLNQTDRHFLLAAKAPAN